MSTSNLARWRRFFLKERTTSSAFRPSTSASPATPGRRGSWTWTRRSLTRYSQGRELRNIDALILRIFLHIFKSIFFRFGCESISYNIPPPSRLNTLTTGPVTSAARDHIAMSVEFLFCWKLLCPFNSYPRLPKPPDTPSTPDSN